jgi:hypothetical protein
MMMYLGSSGRIGCVLRKDFSPARIKFGLVGQLQHTDHGVLIRQ